MNRMPVAALGLLVVAFTVAGCGGMPADSGWTTLIDGEKGLENFNLVGDANWRAEGGAIVGDKGKGGFLVSKGTYRDFQLYAEFWADHTTNSGIFMRCQNPGKIADTLCYEANIFDQRAGPEYSTGGIVHHASVPVPNPYKAGGKWNTYEIHVKGREITVKLNGQATAYFANAQFESGPFALQFGNRPPKGEPGGAIKWRKVAIKPL